MEKFTMVSNGPRSLFVEIPRLTNGAEIGVITLLNVTYTEREKYHVFVVSDQGSKIHHEGSYFDNLLQFVAIPIIGFSSGLIMAKIQKYYLKQKQEKRKLAYRIDGVGHQ